LEHSAARAQARGGLAAAAAFLERAVELSPDPSHRARRALAAAQTKFQSGALEDALDLSHAAESGTADLEVSAHLHLLRAQIAFAARRGSDATPLLLEAARQLELVDPSLARATYLEALSAAKFAGRLAEGQGALDVARAALAGPPMPENPRPSDLLLQGMALRLIEGYAAAAPLITRALSEFQSAQDMSPEDARWLWFASSIALEMWDDTAWSALSTRHLELVRETGELSILPLVLTNRSSVYAFLGQLRAAALLEEEAEAAVEATGIAPALYGQLTIAAVRGDEDAFSSLTRTEVREAAERGEGLALTVAEFLSGTLYNGLRRYDDALAAVGPAEQFVAEGPAIWSLTELIEAATHSGQPERARRAFELLAETTRDEGTDWDLGIEARCRALLEVGDAADALYQEAIERLGHTFIRVQLARTHLLYGEWLRRERRRFDARTQLRTAYDLFREFGVDGFAERARLELEATGERARKRTTETLGQLTQQESQIARLVVEGHTNREIASRLFISPRTVDYHLHKVFRKLGVKSRTQLARHIDQPGVSTSERATLQALTRN